MLCPGFLLASPPPQALELWPFWAQGYRKGVSHIQVLHTPPNTHSLLAPMSLKLASEAWKGGKEGGQGWGERKGQGKVVIYKACALGTLVLDNNYSTLIN